MDSILLLVSKIILVKWQLIFWKFYRKKLSHKAWIDMQMISNELNSHFLWYFPSKFEILWWIFQWFYVSFSKIDPSLYIEILTIQIYGFYSFTCVKNHSSQRTLMFWKFYRKKVIHKAWLGMQMNWNVVNSNFLLYFPSKFEIL